MSYFSIPLSHKFVVFLPSNAFYSAADINQPRNVVFFVWIGTTRGHHQTTHEANKHSYKQRNWEKKKRQGWGNAVSYNSLGMDGANPEFPYCQPPCRGWECTGPCNTSSSLHLMMPEQVCLKEQFVAWAWRRSPSLFWPELFQLTQRLQLLEIHLILF